MQDEDGYITLNIKPRKPTLTSAVTQHKYLLADKESLSATLQQLAKKVCQELIKQTELKTQNTFGKPGLEMSSLQALCVCHGNRREANQSRNAAPGKSFCQILTVPNSVSPSEHKCSPCATNWRYHGDSCYGFFKRNLTWDESKQYCTEQNARLVKAASQKTLEYITSRISSARWIGLSRQNSDKDWMWEDNSIFPKNMIDLSGNTRENMNCAYLYKGKIHPASCEDRHFLMCERKAGLTRVDQLL
ncbi:hypothetical protein U0070_027081 [Myodes glareolus]|uniref:C-type lectin domain-containing protein n=1 Tax=Myodes glareolus TaxID=447135 RepID=A0AAW0H8A2_MYOGA